MIRGTSSSYSTYHYIVLTAASCSIVCHTAGLLSIHLYKKKTNQNVILTFLSLADLMCSAHRILTECLHIPRVNRKLNSHIVTPALRGIFYTALYAMILAYFVCSRLVCSINPLKYKMRMTRRKVHVMVGLSVVFSLIIGLTTGFSQSFGIRKWIC